jgi:outer membrane protein OmpA-like peptidoglycan-associated protein
MNLSGLKAQRMRSIAAGCLTLCMTLLAGVSHAASSIPPFQLEQIVPEGDTGGSLFLGTGLVPVQGTWRINLYAMYEWKPLTIYDGSHLVDVPVKNRVTGILSSAYVLFPRFELTLSLPYVLEQNGDNSTGQGFRPVGGNGFGTPFIGARVGVLQQSSGMPLDLALELTVGPPLQHGAWLAQDNGWDVLPSLILSRKFGPVLISGEARFDLRPTVTLLNMKQGDEVTLGASITTLGDVVRGELSVLGDISLLNYQPPSLEILPGIRIRLPAQFEIFAAIGPGLGSAPGVPAFRGLLGLAYRGEPPPPPPPPPCEKCPDCPAAPACPPAPACPAPAPPPPPPVIDSDHDGIPDDQDKCPNEGGPLSTQGCPEIEITKEKLEIHERILFATSKATILPESFPELDRIAQVLINHQELKEITIEGHTDNVDSHEWNMRLSINRARAVRDYLIKKGVEKERLRYMGYGPDRPVASNDTPEGREKNRRVEFSIVTEETVKMRKKPFSPDAQKPADQKPAVQKPTGAKDLDLPPLDGPSGPEGK